MAGGPIFPHSAFPVDVETFPGFYVGAGANSKEDEGLQIADATTITADVIWRLRFQMPPTLPTGTGKLRILALANATTGVTKPHVKWASVAAEESPSGATLNDETVGTITWGTGDNDQYKELKVTLDADTLVGGEAVVMDLTFENTSMTLAVDSTYQVAIIWE